MSTLVTQLQSLATLRQRIAAHGVLSDEVLRKIEYKFRLECNYHSNKIEGGTLTKPETRSVMIGNITVHGKPLKDIREMQGHDEAMKDVFAVGRSEKRLSESRIRAVHRQIIVAESPAEEAEIGRWKQQGNHVINYRGEKFEFTAPDAVPNAIHDLLNWLNAGLDKIHAGAKDAPDPVLLAFEFHLRYLTIHPFTDGNGRTARLLTNLVLVSLGYPPFWVSEGSEKDAYNRYLADVQAYGGSPDLLFGFLAGLLERSLQITLDAIEGKDIEDADDWKKELRLLKSRLPAEDALRAMRSAAALEQVYANSIRPTLSRVVQELSEFDDLFLKKQLWLGQGGASGTIANESQLDIKQPLGDHTENLHFDYRLEGYKKMADKPVNPQCRLIWHFEQYAYYLIVGASDGKPQLRKPYDEFYDEQEIADIVRQSAVHLLKQINLPI